MDRWSNKVAVVTGASSGIGAEIVKDLVRGGMIVVGLARRSEKIEELKKDLPNDRRKNLHSMQCDVTKEEEIVATFAKINEKFGGVDVLINNAGMAFMDLKLTDPGNSVAFNDTMQTNVFGLINCTREAIGIMKKRKIHGHVININSILGHNVVFPPPGWEAMNFNVYAASKFGVTALTEILRQEMSKDELPIKISSISPDVVQTNLTEMFSKQNLAKTPHLLSSDISQAVVYVLSTPPHVNVQDVLLRPLGCRY
ncbi:farnesol dehydrogenase-like [Lutzomyia longipalpis]|uniref:farnesol dehydrogenase-like n=1 Tax=Lutzomyia longipalpis TaxID=7200 RepID=UPI00248394C5|nr:farnesol dehydrogenase-like [Lutzomyia longipalpis]